MSELEQEWAEAMSKAEARARNEGRTDITEYLALRSANDLVRKIGSDWLLTIFQRIAGENNRQNAGIQISTEEDYRFTVGRAGMVGRRLTLRKGVRALFVEIGWPRMPQDGFIRGGGLACANIKHLGIKSANQELRLVLNTSGTPAWVTQSKHGSRSEIHESDIRNHVATLVNDSQIRPTHS